MRSINTSIGAWLLMSGACLFGPNIVRSQTVTGEALNSVARSIDLPTFDNKTIASVSLDERVYSNTTEQLSDLRIVDDRGIELPFLLHNVVSTTKKTVPVVELVRNPIVKPTEDNGLVIEFEIEPAKFTKPIHGFHLSTNVVNFEHLVSLDRKESDSEEWKTIASDVLLYDYSQFMDVRNTEVPIPKDSEFPVGGRFRMRISQVVQTQQSRWQAIKRTLQEGKETSREEIYELNRQPLRIDRITFSQDFEVVASSQALLRDVSIANVQVTNDQESKCTWIDFDSKRDPLSEVTLETSDSNFSRPSRLLSRTLEPVKDKSEWRPLAATTLTKIDIAGVDLTILALSCPEHRASRYRLVIENGDNPPLEDVQLSAKGPKQELVFVAVAGRSYSVTYGVADRTHPTYDTLAIQTALSANVAPTVATLGDPQPIALEPKVLPERRWYESQELVFAVILGLVVILAAALFQAAKRLNQVPMSSENTSA
jgi:hypothetical protein